MSDSSTDEAFWKQIDGDAKRTVLCEPHRLDEILAVVEARGYDHITVLPSQHCPAGKLFVIDEGAIEASVRAALQRSMRSLYRR
ncbi:hypothetical protein [Streptomyces aureus]|uniref:hypothetical protein n=1 Tax=Streptomyces aureus TaxID=193461 RepID=UPI00056A6894|nr:hypothetical protein [Streptomyces aureus]